MEAKMSNSGIYLVVNRGGQLEQKSNNGSVFQIPNGAVKIGRSKNDIDKHHKEYDRACGQGNYDFEIIFRHDNFALISEIENEVHAQLRSFMIERESGGGRRIEWMSRISRDEALEAFQKILNKFVDRL